MNITEYTAKARAAYDAALPVLESTEMIVKAGALRQSDEYVDGDTALVYVVESTRRGNAKAIVKWEGRKTEARFDPNEDLVIYRQVETEESKAARSALYAEYRAASYVEGRVERRAQLQAKLDEFMAKEWWERVADYATDLAAAAYVDGPFVGWAERLESGEQKSTASEFVAEVVRDFTKRLVNNSESPTYSGGFSSHNAVKQATQDGWRKVLSDLEMHAW